MSAEKLIERLNRGDVHVVALPNDTTNPTSPSDKDPMILESYISHSSLNDAIAVRKRFARYGDGVICKLVPLTRKEIREATKK